MCGVAGILNLKDISTDHSSNLRSMINSLRHRGPDSKGYWNSNTNKIFLGHSRLSILDLSENGAQPMHSKSHRYTMVFNGEIYNHTELRKNLSHTSSDLNWSGTSDTETILALIEKYDFQGMLNLIEGMFAIAVWDDRKQELYLARDRMGEKPLYYGFIENKFVFGSELKAIKKCHGFNSEIDINSLGDYFKYNYVPGSQSIYKDIKKLLPGQQLVISSKDSSLKHSFYWSLDEVMHDSKPDCESENSTQEIEVLLRNVVKSQMISDVPLGAFLSGGVDSSLIVALMQQESSIPVQTFTIGYQNSNLDESEYAKEVASFLGTNHTCMMVSSQDSMDVIPKLPVIYDEPFADSSQIPTYLVSKIARKHVTVALSGDGGDEIFGGYNRYFLTQKIWRLVSSIPDPIRAPLAAILDMQPALFWRMSESLFNKLNPGSYGVSNIEAKASKLIKLMKYAKDVEDIHQTFITSWKPSEILLSDSGKETNILSSSEHLTLNSKHISDINKMMYIDSLSYLPGDILVKVDRAAMSNSLETRAPFLNHKLIEAAAMLPLEAKIKSGRGKIILRDILYKYVPKKLIERPKNGFAVPIGDWIRDPLRDWAEDLLSDNSLNDHGLLNTTKIRSLWAEHLTGKRDGTEKIWSVLMFQSWIKNNN